MVSTITTSAIITELVPNPGEKEIIIETPALTRDTDLDDVQITLADHGIAADGPITIKGYMMSATYGIITINEPLTWLTSGVLTISSTAGTEYPAKRIYRLVGTSL